MTKALNRPAPYGALSVSDLIISRNVHHCSLCNTNDGMFANDHVHVFWRIQWVSIEQLSHHSNPISNKNLFRCFVVCVGDQHYPQNSFHHDHYDNNFYLGRPIPIPVPVAVPYGFGFRFRHQRPHDIYYGWLNLTKCYVICYYANAHICQE